MEPWVIGVMLRPFGALLLFGVIALSIRWAIQRYMRDGWLKRQLLAERGQSIASHHPR